MSELKSEAAVLAEIGRLEINHLATRAFFPYTSEDAVGRYCTEPPKYYRDRPEYFPVIFTFPLGLTNDNVRQITCIGHYLNENVLIRLCSLLEIHEINTDWNKMDDTERSISGAADMWLLRRLRNNIVHTADTDTERQRLTELVEDLKARFPRLPQEPGKFSLDQDQVITPFFESSKAYARGWLAYKRQSA